VAGAIIDYVEKHAGGGKRRKKDQIGV
jgi:hypothetical protein